MASLGELFLKIGVKADKAAVDRFAGGVKTLRSNLLGVQAAALAASVGVERFVNSALKGVTALQNLNNQTGLSIAELQKWQQAGQLSNLALSADQIANSIASVQKNLAQIRIGQGNLAPFQLLGIDVAGQDAFSVLEQLRSSIQGLDPAIATNLISQIGLTPDFINLLKLSRKEFDLLGENVFLNGKQRADIDKVGTSIKALTLRFKALKDQAVAKLAPELNLLVQKFFKYLKDNGDKIVRTITSIARGFASFATAVGRAFDLTAGFIQNLFGMENGVKALAVAFGFLTLSFSPFLAGLAAIILLLEDIAVFRKGGKSLIGELVEAFKDLPDFAKFLGGGLALAGVATSLGSITKGLIAMTGPATLLATQLGLVVGSLVFLAKSPDLGNRAAQYIESAEEGKGGISGFFEGLVAANRSKGLFGETTEQTFKRIRLNPTLAAEALRIENNNNITINGVQNPQAIGREVGGVINNITNESFKRTQATQGNGIR